MRLLKQQILAAVLIVVAPLVARADNTLVVELRGNGVLVAAADNHPKAPAGSACFAGIDIVDLNSGIVIGKGMDCVMILDDMAGPAAESLIVTGTTVFNLPGGQLVTQGTTSIVPKPAGTADPGSPDVTHFTGSIPSLGDSSNAVIHGTGRFRRTRGTARLSGAVDLSGLHFIPGDLVGFRCIFVLSLRK